MWNCKLEFSHAVVCSVPTTSLCLACTLLTDIPRNSQILINKKGAFHCWFWQYAGDHWRLLTPLQHPLVLGLSRASGCLRFQAIENSEMGGPGLIQRQDLFDSLCFLWMVKDDIALSFLVPFLLSVNFYLHNIWGFSLHLSHSAIPRYTKLKPTKILLAMCVF